MGRSKVLTDQESAERKFAWNIKTLQKQKEKIRIKYVSQGYKNFYQGLIPGSLPYKIYNDIKEGIKDTISGFAKKYKLSYNQTHGVLTQLRKHGYFIHPIGTIYGINGQEGTLVDVTENKEYFIEASNNRQKYMANPALVRQIESMEKFLENNPHEYDAILEISESLQTKALEAKKRIREKVTQLKEHGN